MEEPRKIWIDLTEEEMEVLRALQQEMGVDSTDAVVHSLIRQAYARASIVCPACGHSAQKTAVDQARCDSCMSVLQLSEDVWSVVVSRSAA